MSGTTLTGIGGILSTLLVLGIVPIYLSHYTAKQTAIRDEELKAEAAKKAERDRQAVGKETNRVSMNDLNEALAKDRARLKVELEESEKLCDDKLQRMDDRHKKEMQHVANERAKDRQRIEFLEGEVERLHRRILGHP